MLDHYFCGDQYGKPFFAVTRVDYRTGQCPSGTSPCSNSTDPENTICYPQDQLASKCPITETLFVKENQIAKYQNDTATYRVQEVGVGEYFVTSKNSTDSLPITKTVLEALNPCVDPGETTLKSAHDYYPLETDRLKPECSAYDYRFSDTGG